MEFHGVALRADVLVVGVKGMDREQLQLGSSDKFWKLISERRSQATMSRTELEESIRPGAPRSVIVKTVQAETESSEHRSESHERLLSRVIEPWPPSCWTSTFSGGDALTPNVATCLIAEVTLRRDEIRLSVKNQDRLFTAAIHLDGSVRGPVFEILERMNGRTLAEAGQETVGSR